MQILTVTEEFGFHVLDDFKTKSTYSFEITVDSDYKAVTNGLRKSITYKDKSNF